MDKYGLFSQGILVGTFPCDIHFLRGQKPEKIYITHGITNFFGAQTESETVNIKF